ncbi:polysaccharide biosynthesis/export family protein [uncultured Methylovirgula sp.]|uniref:polysaccharide biosynthesis/export family protein n=1 Tax=uncultured Methylovirgula sp. TaxID=1285960 RepID=UPI002603585E|nr:polysaccharide biosynthesis/export family protein [uncultured Methylovirgula sp.]
MRRSFVSLCLLVLYLVLGACATTTYSALLDTNPDAPYTLASGDRLRIIVFGQDSLSNSYAVDGTGHIAMPLIGIVSAAGDTTSTLARKIEARLRDGFIRDPHVSIEVEAFRPFFVLGEVTTPGQYPYVNGMTAETAVAIAGGFTPRAYKDMVDLTRVIDGRPITASVPILHLIRPGDTIVVRERYF